MCKECKDMNKRTNVLGLIMLAAMLPAALYAAYRYHSTILGHVRFETAVCLFTFAVCSTYLCLSRRPLFPFLAVAVTGIAVSVFCFRYACFFLPPLLILCCIRTVFSEKTEDRICLYFSLFGEAVCTALTVAETVKETLTQYGAPKEATAIRITAIVILFISAAFCLFLFNRSFTAIKPQKHGKNGKTPTHGKSANSSDKLHTLYLMASLSAIASAVGSMTIPAAFIAPAAALAWCSMFVSLSLCGDPVMAYLKRRIGKST